MNFSRIFQPDFEVHFLKISTFFVFLERWFYWCVMWSQFLLTQRNMSSGPLRYLEHVHKVYRKISKCLWKKFQLQKWVLKAWSSKSIWNILTKPYVLSWNFFQRPLENVLWTLWTCSRYLKGPPKLNLCISKRIVTALFFNRVGVLRFLWCGLV